MKKNFRIIIGLLMLAIIVFVIFNLNRLEKEIKEKQYSHLINDLSKVTNNFGIWISNKKEMLDTTKDVVDNYTYDELIMYNTGNPLLNINNHNPDVTQVYVGLKDGGFITGGQWVPPDEYDPRSRVWYQEAVEADETIVSKTYIDQETGDRLVTISSPLYLKEGFVGVIATDVFLNNIHEFLKGQLLQEDFYTYLVDQEGTIIVHTGNELLVGLNIYYDIKDETLINYFDEVKQSNEIINMEYAFNNQEIRGIVKKVEGGDWYLTVATVYNNSLWNIERFNKENLIFNGLILLIIFILIYMIIRMKSDLEDKNEWLTNDNEKDYLTGVYNRRYLNVYMENLWKSAKLDRTISLLMIDIDKFKEYNDTYGHIHGDDVIQKVATCINTHSRKSDILARYGGEEFSLILENVPQDLAYTIAEKIRQAVVDLGIEHVSSQYKCITISIGVITVDMKEKKSVRETIDAADMALYKAKEKGRNTVFVYKEDM